MQLAHNGSHILLDVPHVPPMTETHHVTLLICTHSNLIGFSPICNCIMERECFQAIELLRIHANGSVQVL